MGVGIVLVVVVGWWCCWLWWCGGGDVRVVLVVVVVVVLLAVVVTLVKISLSFSSCKQKVPSSLKYRWVLQMGRTYLMKI